MFARWVESKFLRVQVSNPKWYQLVGFEVAQNHLGYHTAVWVFEAFRGDILDSEARHCPVCAIATHTHTPNLNNL